MTSNDAGTQTSSLTQATIPSIHTTYAIRQTQGKGLGVFATRNIPKGTRILADDPLITLSRHANDKQKNSRSISDQLASLPPEQREAFLMLHDAFHDEESRELGIARTNALPLGTDATHGGVFLEASRINHACNNNAQNTWNEPMQKLTIHATRDIQEGDEVTIYYLARFSNRATRQAALRSKFRFDCACGLCLLPEAQRQASDQRLDEIQNLDDWIGSPGMIESSPLRVLHWIRRLLRLVEEEGISGTSVSSSYYDAFQVAVTHGDLARAREFADRASNLKVIAEGQDSPGVRRFRQLAADPSGHCAHGTSSAWVTAYNSSPRGLDTVRFEDWLWKAQCGAQAQLADLRSDMAFPTFECLPGENDIDLDYLETDDGLCYRPCKHWCLLAEIVDIEIFLRLKLMIRDRTGRTIPLVFYTDSRGRELSDFQIQEGYTAAVLYGKKHEFLDMSIGIRHENPQLLKIFPISMNGLLELSDRVKTNGATDGHKTTCHACGKTSDTLKKCGRCSLFWYCDKTCQATGWNEKGHKGDCKLLKDADLQDLFRVDWSNFRDYHHFK